MNCEQMSVLICCPPEKVKKAMVDLGTSLTTSACRLNINVQLWMLTGGLDSVPLSSTIELIKKIDFYALRLNNEASIVYLALGLNKDEKDYIQDLCRVAINHTGEAIKALQQ